MPGNQEQLLQAILATSARQTFPPDRLAELVAPKKVKGDKQTKAFNLCDGTRTQGEIAKALKLDQGNFSRTVSRWVDAGIVFRLGEGREAKLLHAYPMPENGKNKES